MMLAQTHTFPSLSGTFGIHTGLALSPKMPKEPSSPSLSNARIERQCFKNETNRLEYNNGQRTTCGIKHWGLSGYANNISRIKVYCTLIVKCLRTPQQFHTAIRCVQARKFPGNPSYLQHFQISPEKDA